MGFWALVRSFQDGAGGLAALALMIISLCRAVYQPVRWPRHTGAGERGFGCEREACPGESSTMDDEAAMGELLRHKVERPAVVGRIGASIGALVQIERLRSPQQLTASNSSR